VAAKFKWWTERPITVTREKLDPDFLSHVITPAFPGYVSGHATVSGAASAVLSAFFPDRADELQGMAEEAAMSRLYAGIHSATTRSGARARPPGQRASDVESAAGGHLLRREHGERGFAVS
jgi:membrane-associated phospholipid phosphatase